MNAEELSRALRTSDHPDLARRRMISGLTLGSIGIMGLITLYQMGIIKRMPEAALPYLNADKVDASEEAYARLAMPDGALGIVSYAVTLALASMAGPDRARTRPLIPLALTAKAAVDAIQAGQLTVDQWVRHRAFCSWCLLTAGITFAVLPMTIPEARSAWRSLRRQGTKQSLRRTLAVLGGNG